MTINKLEHDFNYQSAVQPILAGKVGNDCSALSIAAYSSCEMNGCTLPRQLRQKGQRS